VCAGEGLSGLSLQTPHAVREPGDLEPQTGRWRAGGAPARGGVGLGEVVLWLRTPRKWDAKGPSVR